MTKAMDLLNLVKARLDGIEDVKTCQIGIEPDISPADYPIIRIVPAKAARTDQPLCSRRNYDLLVYFAAALDAFDGMSVVYDALFEIEHEIITRMESGDGFRLRYVETIADEDRLPTFKVFVSRFEAIG